MSMVLRYENSLNLKFHNHYLLFLAILLYSLSTPFPKSIGLIEFFIAIFMTMFLYKYFLSFIKNPNVFSLLFMFLLLVPLVRGVFNNNDIINIFRDIIPFFYFFTPFVLLSSKIKLTKDLKSALPYILTVPGIIFSIREIINFVSTSGKTLVTNEYLVQSPIVIFSAIFLFNLGLLYIIYKSFFKGLFLILISLIPFFSFFAALLRAPTLLFILSITIFALALLVLGEKSIKKFIFFFISVFIIFIFIIINLDIIKEYLLLLKQKQELYGTNSKLDELFYSLELTINSDFLTFMLGSGWGGTWYSPAVGKHVRFAHSLITFSIIKLGFIGILLILVYLIYLARTILYSLYKSVKNKNFYDLNVILACSSAIFINTFLESAYKTLDYGIILLNLFLIYKFYTNYKGISNDVPKFI